MKLVIDVDEKLVCEGFDRNFTEEERDILIRAIGNGTLYEERPQGEWKFKQFDEETGISNNYWCPFCGVVKTQVYDNFCGNCGADMRGDDNGLSVQKRNRNS